MFVSSFFIRLLRLHVAYLTSTLIHLSFLSFFSNELNLPSNLPQNFATASTHECPLFYAKIKRLIRYTEANPNLRQSVFPGGPLKYVLDQAGVWKEEKRNDVAEA